MSRISYFQRFTQRENHATNNALLILRRFYDRSPLRLERILHAILDDGSLKMGITFEQQVKGSDSVPDALIQQNALRIFFETKRDDALDEAQIGRHIQSITNSMSAGCTNVLIGLTKEPIHKLAQERITTALAGKHIIFKSITFSELVRLLQDECAPHEVDLQSLVDDFEEYLAEEKLLEEWKRYLAIFPCRVSFQENKKFGIYYESPTRERNFNCRLIGLYLDKKVALIGEVKCILVARLEGDELILEHLQKGNPTDEDLQRVKTVIHQTTYYDLRVSQRYYLSDCFYPTELLKASPGGVRGVRYLDIPQLLNDPDILNRPVSEIAKRLEGEKFN